MGMHTELYLCCQLQETLPEPVVAVLKFLFNNGPAPHSSDLPDHPFFQCPRWGHVGNTSSYYFVPAVVKHFAKNSLGTEYNLIFRCDLKNYDKEIEKFLSWIFPYLDKDIENYRHIGHFRYEEDLAPTLIFYGRSDLCFTEGIGRNNA